MSGEDVIHVPCPHCQHVSKTRREHIGKSATCNECGKSFVISEVHVEDCKKCGEPMDRQLFSTCPHCGHDPRHAFDKPRHVKPERRRFAESPSAKTAIGIAKKINLQRRTTDEYGRTIAFRNNAAPRYWALSIAARIIEVIGVADMVIAVLWVMWMFSAIIRYDGMTFRAAAGLLLSLALALVGGLVIVAFAHLLKAVRDIAINSYLTTYNTSERD